MTLAFWFEFASTYSYLSAMRIEAAAQARGVAVDWQPFLLGPIFAKQGWTTSPFNLFADKGRHMWRDVARQSACYGLPFRRPGDFPRNGLTAARIACAARGQPWLPGFVRGVFTANFAEDRDIADPAVLAGVLASLDGADASWVERAAAPEVKAALFRQSREAAALGLFGAPSFVVGGELFWGDDRLDQAIAAAADGAGDDARSCVS